MDFQKKNFTDNEKNDISINLSIVIKETQIFHFNFKELVWEIIYWIPNKFKKKQILLTQNTLFVYNLVRLCLIDEVS